jgi:RNA polymerase sigma factor (sigma-70 family)
MSDPEAKLRALMALSQNGDAKAYRILLETLKGRLTAYFSRRLTSDAGSADDLVQETLMAIHVKRATYDPGQAFTGWFYAIARYKLIDHYRRYKVRRTEPLDEAAFVEDMADDFAAASARMDLDELLARLPEKQARAIRMTKITGLTSAEAAQAMNVSESAIKVSVHRGLKSAAATLEDDPGDRS